MNFSQKTGLFILAVISAVYVYFAFFGGASKIPPVKTPEPETSPLPNETEKPEPIANIKKVKIFISDKDGKIRQVYRDCDTSVQKSCFEFAIKELLNAPSKWEKSKGFTSDIPQNTKILSVRESAGSIMIDLTSAFESGGGSDSIYKRLNQLIKTVNSNTSLPVYLYLNGVQVNVIGGDGIMLKQPLNERSLDE